jgi:hypothetical protein
MSDGREEREEREKRRELEERESREDRIDRDHADEWEQERVDSKAASAGEAVVEGAAATTDEGAAQAGAMQAVRAEEAAEAAQAAGVLQAAVPTGVPDAAVAAQLAADNTADNTADKAVKAESGKHTRRSFLVAAAGAVAAYEGYKWLDNSPMVGRQQAAFRKAWGANADVARDVFRERGIAPTFAKEKAVDLRFNGPYGLRQEMMLDSWRLKLVGVENPKQYRQYLSDVTTWEYKEIPNMAMSNGSSGQSAPTDDSKGPGQPQAMWTRATNGDGTPMRGQEEAGESDTDLDDKTPGLLLTLDDLKMLPHRELVTEFKCIEGWSEVVHWGGVRLLDLIDAYPPVKDAQGRLPKYVYMETPYGDYYCGYNMAACTHPQSLLAMEMSGAPLSQQHGAPLRLHMPIKYGYKQIKRVALIHYTDTKPDDYWTKLGYDWYAGL